LDDWSDWVRSAQDAERPLAERHRSFGHLVARFQDMAFGAAYGVLGDTGRAEDAAQEAFIAAWHHLPDLRVPEAFPAWLGSLVRTACNRQVRRRIVPTVPLEENASFLHMSGPHASAEQRERSAQVRDAVAALPESERLPVILFHVAEYSREEVAAFLGVSLITVKRRLASARGKLRERLLIMLQDDLQESRPSNAAVFAARVLAFTKLFRILNR
jgi:RNA polymerase sigma-70 factor (ECF subfamily)